MILKYKVKNTWGFIDNIRQIAHEDIEPFGLAKQYDEEIISGKRIDIVNECNVSSDSIKTINKAFLLATEGLEIEGNWHMENLLSEELCLENYPAHIIIAYIEDCKDYNVVVMLTNNDCYLMNNEGKTIERLS